MAPLRYICRVSINTNKESNMTSKIKVLGLALIAFATTSALQVSAAHAGSLDVGASPAVITGHSETNQSHTVTLTATNGQKVNAVCNTASAEGTTQGQNLTEATITPTFGQSETAPTGCTLGGQISQVRMNGCKFTLTGEGSPSSTALVDVVGCTSGMQIQNKSALCTLDIPEQNGLAHVVATNLAGGKEVTFNSTIAGIKVTQTGAACPDGNNHVSTNASITGNTIIKAFKDSGTKQVTKHGHQYVEHLCGEQVTILTT
jgi:hypothetical protein